MSAYLAVVLQPSLDLYPALPYRGENFRAVVRIEACACGGAIALLAGGDVMRTVGDHNRTPGHLWWRERIT